MTAPRRRRRLSASDVRGGVRLVTNAVTGVTDVVEAVHATVSQPAGRPTRTRGIAGWVYRLIRWITRGVGRTVDQTLSLADRHALPADGPAREAVVAALNGAFGDALVRDANPLATPLTLRHDGRPLRLDGAPLDVPDASATLLVLVHGICMHDEQWGAPDHDMGGRLADGLGATRIGVRYNSGRHISESGRDLAGALDALVGAWPVPVRRLVVVGHSMGGLVARSAWFHATTAGLAWPGLDASLAMLGSPHHGAPLERLGNHVDTLLGATRVGAPFARIGQIRSVGVTDLRHGSVHDADWAGRDRFARAPDARTPLPLPSGVACYVVAGTTGDGTGSVRDQAVGDGLVPLDSALGRHPDPARDLGVPPDRQWVSVGMHHFDLIRRPEVTAQLLAWLRR